MTCPTDLQAKPNAQAKARARGHYKKGKAAFELGRFSEALKEYEKAYKNMPLPGFLFNIGQCHRNLGQYNKAIFSFRLFLRKKPKASNRVAVMRLIEELESKAADQPAEEEATPSDPEPDPSPAPETTPQYSPAEPEEKVPEFAQPPPPPPITEPPPKPYYKKWWFWVPVAAVALGGGALGAYFAVRSKEPDIPQSPFPTWEIPSN